MSGYVIYLSSNTSKGMSHESYGYWRGKTYQVQGETFPVTDIEVTPDTKVYKSKKRAENSAEKIFDKCGYVVSWFFEEI
ncbi:hypothetical protein [Bacillus thuringiensis]|uniref:hypothetical protein n=1 Tax=Bacillus thuringiensis TaxID=1428 RepID=UPI000BFBBA19|nr:hypothetical protein [Bacillus thuringiensis]PGY54970.1 hypothetical protein COE09_15490 [Bacillus thuringiensis]